MNCAKELFESTFYHYCNFYTCKLANIESHQLLDCATLQLFDVYFAFNEPKIACLAIISSNKKFVKNIEKHYFHLDIKTILKNF